MKEYNKVFNKFYNRLKLEGFLKALGISSVISAVPSIILCVIIYLTASNSVWIPIVTFISITALFTFALYMMKFKPNKTDVAKRVDMLGLKERMLAMVEMEGNDSFMAKKQREDAYIHLEKVKNTKLKFRFSKCFASVMTLVLAVYLTTVTLTAVSISGGVPGIDDIIKETEKIPNVNIAYLEEEGGYIDGEIFQVIQAGDDGTEVVAVPEDGYMFDSWSDGVTTPNRIDTAVEESFEVFAIFIEIGEGQSPLDKEDENMMDGGFDLGDIEGEMPPGGGAAGKYEEFNQVIDGSTYYRDVYEQFYDEAIEILNAGGTVPEYIREIIENYYGVIK